MRTDVYIYTFIYYINTVVYQHGGHRLYNTLVRKKGFAKTELFIQICTLPFIPPVFLTILYCHQIGKYLFYVCLSVV